VKIQVLQNRIYKSQLHVEIYQEILKQRVHFLEEAFHLFKFVGDLDDLAFEDEGFQFLVVPYSVFPTYQLEAAGLQNTFRHISMFSFT